MILWAKAGLSLLLAAATGLLIFSPKKTERFVPPPALSWVLLRVLPFVVVYLLAGIEPQSDLVGFYNGAAAALQGKLVYRDFISVYAPLYAYLTALPLLVWNHPKALVLFMILIEGLVLWATARRYGWPGRQVLLYLLMPGSLLLSVIGGQEDVWMWGCGLLLLYGAIERRSWLLAGMAVGAAMVITKALFVVVVPALLVLARRPAAFVGGALLLGLPVLAWQFLSSEWAFLMPLQLGREPLSPNLWSVLYPLAGGWLAAVSPSLLNYAGLAGVMGVSSFWAWRHGRHLPLPQAVAVVWVLAFSLVMLLVRSAYANYIFAFLMPLLAARIINFSSRREVAVLLVFNILCIIQPSLWWRLGQPFYRLTDLARPAFLLEYLLEAGIVAGLLYFIVLCFRPIGSGPHSAAPAD